MSKIIDLTSIPIPDVQPWPGLREVGVRLGLDDGVQAVMMRGGGGMEWEWGIGYGVVDEVDRQARIEAGWQWFW